MKPKRILFVVSSMHRGGAERVAAALCNRMAQEGWEVILMPTFSEKGDCLYQLHDKVVLDFLSDRVANVGDGFLNKLRRLKALRNAVKEVSPDVVISFLTHVNVISIIAAIGLNIPVIVSERVYPPAWDIGKLWRFLRRKTYPLADAVVMQTNKGKDWLTREIPSAKGLVIPNPVYNEMHDSQSDSQAIEFIPETRKVLLAVGRLETQKGFDILINVFAPLSVVYPQWDLVIVGEGSQRAALEAQSVKAGLEKRVHLPGASDNVQQWYKRADVFVLSSRFEGFPNALLEAMAQGLPVVSFDCDTGPGDLIEHEKNGLLSDYTEDGRALAGNLGVLLSDDSKRVRLGISAIKVRESFDIEKVFDAWRLVL